MVNIKKVSSVIGNTSLLAIGITIMSAGVEQLNEGNYEIAIPLLAIGLGMAGLGVYLIEKGIVQETIKTLKE